MLAPVCVGLSGCPFCVLLLSCPVGLWVLGSAVRPLRFFTKSNIALDVTLLARFAAAPRSRPPRVSLSRPPPPQRTRGALNEPSSHLRGGGCLARGPGQAPSTPPRGRGAEATRTERRPAIEGPASVGFGGAFGDRGPAGRCRHGGTHTHPRTLSVTVAACDRCVPLSTAIGFGCLSSRGAKQPRRQQQQRRSSE